MPACARHVNGSRADYKHIRSPVEGRENDVGAFPPVPTAPGIPRLNVERELAATARFAHAT